MAKTANSKIIFMPGPTGSGDLIAKALDDEGPSSSTSQADPVQNVINTRVLENM
jgi:hypothetical protein